jgi:hypothetical protein
MNRHDRRGARTAAPRHVPVPLTPVEQQANRFERLRLFTANKRELRAASEKLAPGDVLVLCDSRDPVARHWIECVAKMTDADIRRWEAPIVLGQMIPTAMLAVPRQVAINLTAGHAPAASEALRTWPSGHRAALVIAANGTTMMSLQQGTST